MTRTPTLLPLSFATLLAMGTEASAQSRATLGEPAPSRTTLAETVRPVRGASARPRLPLPFRGASPANDDCSGAEAISLVHWTTCGTSATAGDNGSALESATPPGCDDPESAVQDVWYTFNSGTYSTVYITLTPGTDMTDYGFAVYDACGGDELACEIVPDGMITVAVAAGTDYLIQVYSNLDWGVGGSFSLCVAYEDADPPANDDCSSVVPEALAVGGSVTFNGTTVGASIAGDFVDPTGLSPVVWHGITLATCATLTIDFCGTSPAFTNGYGFIGTSCPFDMSNGIDFSDVDDTVCDDDNFTITYINVPAGTYYIPVLSDMVSSYGEYTLNVAAVECFPVPANDDCASVTPEPLAIGGSVTFNGTTAGATINGDFVNPEGASPVVWHAVTLATCATLTVDLCGTTPGFTAAYGFIGTTCPMDDASVISNTSANSTTCGDGNYTITYMNVPAGTYYIPVRSVPGTAYGEYTLNVAAAPCIDPPANDDCAGAISITPTTTCTPVAGTTLVATESMPGETCSTYTGTADDDVWYSFVATSSSMTIGATTVFDGVLATYSGTCDDLQPIECIDAALSGQEETLTLDGLTPTDTYYYRIYSYSATAPADPTFTTCVTGPDGTGLAEHGVAANWSLFPNPGNGLLNIAYVGTSGQATIEVMDLSGRLVHSEQRYLVNGQTAALNLSGRLATGAYSVRLTNSTGRSTQRAIVE